MLKHPLGDVDVYGVREVSPGFEVLQSRKSLFSTFCQVAHRMENQLLWAANSVLKAMGW